MLPVWGTMLFYVLLVVVSVLLIGGGAFLLGVDTGVSYGKRSPHGR